MQVNRSTIKAVALLHLAIFFWPQAVHANECSDTGAGELVQRFYRVGGHPSSVPPLAKLQTADAGPYSLKLLRLLISAAKYRDEFIATHPPEHSNNGSPPVIYKPPFVDGDIFTGSPDGALLFTIDRLHSPESRRWHVSLTSVPEPIMSPWAITVVVLDEGKGCAIDDVLYGPASSEITLSKSLSSRW